MLATVLVQWGRPFVCASILCSQNFRLSSGVPARGDQLRRSPEIQALLALFAIWLARTHPIARYRRVSLYYCSHLRCHRLVFYQHLRRFPFLYVESQ